MEKIEKEQVDYALENDEKDNLETLQLEAKNKKNQLKVLQAPKLMHVGENESKQHKIENNCLNNQHISVYNFISNPIIIPDCIHNDKNNQTCLTEPKSNMDELVSTLVRTKKKYVAKSRDMIQNDLMKVLDDHEVKVYIRLEKFDKHHSQPHIRYHINVQNLTKEVLTDIDIKYKTDVVDFKLMLNKTQIENPIKAHETKNIDFLMFLFDFPFEFPELVFKYSILVDGNIMQRYHTLKLSLMLNQLIKFIQPNDTLFDNNLHNSIISREAELNFDHLNIKSEKDMKDIFKDLKMIYNSSTSETYEGLFLYILDQNGVYRCKLTINYAKNAILINLARRDNSENSSKTWILDKILLAFKDIFEMW